MDSLIRELDPWLRLAVVIGVGGLLFLAERIWSTLWKLRTDISVFQALQTSHERSDSERFDDVRDQLHDLRDKMHQIGLRGFKNGG